MKFFLHFSFIVPEGTWFRTSRCVEQGFSHLWVRETRGIAPAGASRGFPLAPASFGIAFLHSGLHSRAPFPNRMPRRFPKGERKALWCIRRHKLAPFTPTDAS